MNEKNQGINFDDPNEDVDSKIQEENINEPVLDNDNNKAEDDVVNKNIVEENVQLVGIKVQTEDQDKEPANNVVVNINNHVAF